MKINGISMKNQNIKTLEISFIKAEILLFKKVNHFLFLFIDPYRNRVILFLSLVVGVFGYDYYFSRNHKTEMQNKMNK